LFTRTKRGGMKGVKQVQVKKRRKVLKRGRSSEGKGKRKPVKYRGPYQ